MRAIAQFAAAGGKLSACFQLTARSGCCFFCMSTSLRQCSNWCMHHCSLLESPAGIGIQVA